MSEPDWKAVRIDALRAWRNADHEDAITLCRSDVCVVLDEIDRLRDALARLSNEVVGLRKTTLSKAPADWRGTGSTAGIAWGTEMEPTTL